MANAIAIRWSSAEFTTPPFNVCPPGTNKPSSNSSTIAPIARRFCTTRAMRSDSFTRSSFASRIRTPSRVYGPIAASTGSSSMISAGSVPVISTPFSTAGPFTWIVPTISPCSSARSSTFTFNPIAATTSSSADREGFMPTASNTICESGKSSAAHKKNAAEDRSPGTAASTAFSLCPPRIEIVPSPRSNSAPNARNACSLWSRVRTDSCSVVTPSAPSPANNTAVFTCALAIGVANSIAFNRPPTTVIGACPSVSSTRAPICSSGPLMRCIGRFVSEASPTNVYVPGCDATSPASIRIVDPELPQSRSRAGCANAPPTPVTSITPSARFTTEAPSASMQASELCGSAPVEKLLRCDVPSASPANMA